MNAPTLDPFQPIRTIVSDPMTVRVLARFCETRRLPETTLEQAVANVVAAVQRGELSAILRLAALPEGLWREERFLSAAIMQAVGPFGGQTTTPALLEALRDRVTAVVQARYPRKPPRLVRKTVRGAVGVMRSRLEIRTSDILDKLAR